MKRLPQSYFSAYLGVVHLCESDLVELMALMRPGPTSTVSIRKGHNEFEGIPDLRLHRGNVHRTLSLVTQSSGTTLDVEFRRHDVHIFASADHENEYRKTREFLLTRRRASGHISYLSWRGIGMAIWGFSNVAPFIWKNRFSAAVPVLVMVYLYLVPKPFLRNRIVLSREHEYETFVQRHHDNIWRLVIAVLAAAAAAGLTWYLKK